LKRKRQPVVIFCLFVLCVFISFSVRTYHYNNSVYALNFLIHDIPESELAPKPGFWKNFLPGYHRNFSPFTIESAMMYSYAQDIAEGKKVLKSDPGLCGMEDIPPYAQMNMGLEWFLGWGWRMKNFFFPDPAPDGKQILFQDHPYMAQWMSGQLRLWASLTSGFVFLWLITLGCGKCFALFGGLLHAVSLAAVARSTGQDIVRGEFCIPLITASVVLAYCIFRKPKIWKYILLFCTSFLAFVSWDLCQMLFGTWMCMELVRFFFGGKMSVSRGCVWLTISLAILMNALFVPFNITYGLIRSSVVWIMIPAVAVVYLYSYLERKYHYFESKKAIWKISVKIFLAVFVPLALYFLWNTVANTPEYASNYSHFGEAMKAKLAFWNVKPANPQMLSYDARIMWTPSMHSATWNILITFFPSLFFGLKMNFCLFRFIFGYLPVTLTVFLSFLLGVVLFRIPRVQFCKRWQSHLVPLLYSAGFLWGFVYIVRYHEFLILFMSVSLSLLLQSAWRSYRCQPSLIRQEYAYTKLYGMKRFSVIMRILIAVLMIFCLSWETYASLF